MVCWYKRRHVNKRNTCIYYFPLPPLILHIFSRHLTTLTHYKCIHPLLCAYSSGATRTRGRCYQKLWVDPSRTNRVCSALQNKSLQVFFPHFKLHLFRINTLNVSRILRLQSCNKTQPCCFRPSRTDRLDLSCFLKTTDENKNQRLISFQCYAICRRTDGAAVSARVCVKQITWLD